MENNEQFKNIFLVGFLILCVVGVIYIPKLLRKNNEGITNIKYIEKDKYKVNEYIPVYVDDMQMSKKYLKDYINQLIYNIDDSYELLDRDYRNKVFGNVEIYKNYIYSLNLSGAISVNKYATYENGGYKFYDIIANDGHRFVFRTKGVMQYNVYFDDFLDSEGEE